MDQPVVFINDSFVPAAAAALPVADLALQRGYGIFDFFKTVHNKPVFLDDHLRRFYQSADQMRLPVRQSPAALKAVIHELIQRNNIPDAGIRISCTGGITGDGYSITSPNLVITQQPLSPLAADAFEKGLTLLSYNHQRQLPEIKTIDYLMAIWLQPLVQQQQADDLLYFRHGLVTECPRANIFIVTEDDTVVTPGRNILKGITRKHVLQLAQDLYKVAERDVTLDELRTAKEVFICSTTKYILPVLQLDGAPVGNGRPGAATAKLNEVLRAYVHSLCH
ncbi:MAG TPA: aminotransferase class IV [Chitinophaga sp.]|uniref:aminotransferase class IV n=1 Tax=Chitinophaga sp. TaxID=1869181 RepID=UPI002DB68101|nr:aminotransferase class IV [Chitinophaga sp.]HEU4552479.1 aminotransferase class IV [Chitinophaga sp.]